MSHKINHLELKAMRQSLGLTASEACEFVPNAKGEPISLRYFQYIESGKRPISDELDLIFFTKASHYTLLLEKLTSDIERWHKDNPRPTSDDADEYRKQIKSAKKLKLPFFHNFDDFVKVTKNENRAYWKIWQAVIGHLFLIGKLHHLDDTAPIPTNFECWRWLNGDYNHQ